MKKKHEMDIDLDTKINFETLLLFKNLMADIQKIPEENKALIEIIDALIRSGGKYLSVEKATGELEKLYQGGYRVNGYVTYALALLLSYEKIYHPIYGLLPEALEPGFFYPPPPFDPTKFDAFMIALFKQEALEAGASRAKRGTEDLIFADLNYRAFLEKRLKKEVPEAKTARTNRIAELYKLSARERYLPAYAAFLGLKRHNERQAIECINRIKEQFFKNTAQRGRAYYIKNFPEYLYAFCAEYGISREEISGIKEFVSHEMQNEDYTTPPHPDRLIQALKIELLKKTSQDERIGFVVYFIGYCVEYGILGNTAAFLPEAEMGYERAKKLGFKSNPAMLIKALEEAFLSQVGGYALRIQVIKINQEILIAITNIIERRDCPIQALSIALKNQGDTVNITPLLGAIQRNRNLVAVSLSGFEKKIPLVALVENETLTALDLSDNDHLADLEQPISHLLKNNKTLVHLRINHPTAGRPDMKNRPLKIFGSLAHNTTLTFLGVSRVFLHMHDFFTLRETLSNNTGLRELDFSRSNHGQAEIIPWILYRNPFLTVLNLSYNGLSDFTISAIARALQGHPSLCKLDLSGNTLEDEATTALASLLRVSKTITELKVDYPLVLKLGKLQKTQISQKSALDFVSSLGFPGNPLRTLHFPFDSCEALPLILTTLKTALKHNKTLTNCPITLPLATFERELPQGIRTIMLKTVQEVLSRFLGLPPPVRPRIGDLSQEITSMVKANKEREETLCFYWSQISIAASFMRANTPDFLKFYVQCKTR